jgi:uncharacterized metal-binding protein
VGQVADLTARRLRDEGFAGMTCLAGVGADISGFVQSAKGAGVNITIDGCPVACARKCLERAGLKPQSYVLTEFGLVKGSTPVTDETVAKMCETVRSESWTPQKERADQTAGNCSCGGNC